MRAKLLDKLAPYLVWLFCAEDATVAVVYLFTGNYRMAAYWAAAAAICAAVPK
jgi:hypothetical protein